MVRNFVFQFPSNGKVCSKPSEGGEHAEEEYVSIPFKRESM